MARKKLSFLFLLYIWTCWRVVWLALLVYFSFNKPYYCIGLCHSFTLGLSFPHLAFSILCKRIVDNYLQTFNSVHRPWYNSSSPLHIKNETGHKGMDSIIKLTKTILLKFFRCSATASRKQLSTWAVELTLSKIIPKILSHMSYLPSIKSFALQCLQ